MAVTVIDSDTTAAIGDASVNTTNGNAGASASQGVVVRAGNTVDTFSFAGSAAAGAGALAGAIDVGSVRNDTAATIGTVARNASARPEVAVHHIRGSRSRRW